LFAGQGFPDEPSPADGIVVDNVGDVVCVDVEEVVMGVTAVVDVLWTLEVFGVEADVVVEALGVAG
jgi:hypothetical protein